MSQTTVPSRITTATTDSSLMPEAVTNLYQGVNSLCRTFRKGCEGVERTVEGIDELATIALSQQTNRLRAELTQA